MDNNLHNPPKSAEKLIKIFSEVEEEYSLYKTLHELYYLKYQKSGKFRANLWYWRQVLYSLIRYQFTNFIWSFVMFKNYLKTTFRSMFKNKVFSIINISGLAIGMTCCVLILLWVLDELSFDKFHKNIKNIYSVVNYDPDDSPVRYGNSVPAPVAPVLKEEYPEIINTARFRVSGKLMIKYNNKVNFENGGGFADPSFFEIFTCHLLQGNPETALSDLYSIVLTEEFAEKYFAEENPVGKVLNVNSKWDFTVSGVVKKLPQNSSIRFDFLIRFEIFGLFNDVDMNNWGWYSGYRAFVLLPGGSDYKQVSEKISKVIPEHYPTSDNLIKLLTFEDFHLYGFNQDGTITNVLIFSILAACTLIIACINFVNLTTARSSVRLKEIGMRKVIGAGRKDLIYQFLGEAIIMSFIALIFAFILVVLLLPVYNDLSGKQLSVFAAGNINGFLSLLLIALFTGIVSGFYPAFLLSSYQPVSVMKGIAKIGTRRGVNLRKILVILQFTISIGLIICTIVILSQLNYIRNKNLGFDKEHLIYIEIQGELKNKYELIKGEILRNRNVLSVTKASTCPNITTNHAGDLDWEGSDPNMEKHMSFISVDYDYFRTIGVKIVEGRSFSKKFPADEGEGFILNEEAVKHMKIDSPVGKFFRMWHKKGKIIGVAQNYHNQWLKSKISPQFFTIWPYFDAFILINIKSENVSETIAHIEKACGKFNPGYPFEYRFLDESIDSRYRAEKKFGSIFKYFTIVAIFISCLGLLGLASFTARQRTKEIGIRKVLGSPVKNIVLLISREFTILVILANIISWPLAYYYMNKWLQGFAYHIGLSIEIFLFAAVLAFAISLVTVSYHVIKAARANPVDSLRYE